MQLVRINYYSYIFLLDNKMNIKTDFKNKRILLKLISLLSVIFICYSIFCYAFLIFSKRENIRTKNHLQNIAPDLIVVFTGDGGRINYAIDQAIKFKKSKIFISGVYSKNTVESILIRSKKNIDLESFSKRVHIDYLARNTVENAISTFRYLAERPEIKNILLITHDYHIMRTRLIVDKVKMHRANYNINYYGIKTNYEKFRNIKLLYKEVYKLIRAYGFLLLWEQRY